MTIQSYAAMINVIAAEADILASLTYTTCTITAPTTNTPWFSLYLNNGPEDTKYSRDFDTLEDLGMHVRTLLTGARLAHGQEV